MRIYVLLYDTGQDSEGIHSIELSGETVVLMFEDADDAERYCGLLEAQDFPRPTPEELERTEIESFCDESGYKSKLVESGFIPKTPEERMLLVPPKLNRDVADWQNNENLDESENIKKSSATDDQLDDIRKRLEGLL